MFNDVNRDRGSYLALFLLPLDFGLVFLGGVGLAKHMSVSTCVDRVT